jgi:hypothetical protein
MMARRAPRDGGHHAVAILATSFVLAGGITTCIAIILSSDADPRQPILLLGAILLGFVVVYLMLGPKRTDLVGSLWVRRTPEKKVRVRFQRPNAKSSGGTSPGAIAPPSADTIRAIQANQNVWVRANTPANPNSEPDDSK